MNQRFEFLKKSHPFNLLAHEVLLGLVDLLEEKTYVRNGVIYNQEESKLRGVDLIVKGHYESFFYDSLQNKRVVELHEPFDTYGGISVLLNRKKNHLKQ